TVPFPELKRTIGDAVLIHETKDPRRLYLFCRAENLGELTATTHALERLPGVNSVQLSLNREMLMATDYVHGLIREEISKHGKFVPEEENLRDPPAVALNRAESFRSHAGSKRRDRSILGRIANEFFEAFSSRLF